MYNRSSSRSLIFSMKHFEPLQYSNRDILLFLQLLHTNNLIDPSSVHDEQNIQILNSIADTWFNHKSTKLSQSQGLIIDSPWTIHQMHELYDSLLKENETCKNTTDLANKVYGERIQELETKLAGSQTDFLLIIEDIK